MAANTTVTNIEIVDAGEALQREGKRVNGYQLRTKLGRGDPRRLEAVWNGLQAQQADGQAAAPQDVEGQVEVPPDVAAALQALIDRQAGELKAAGQRLWGIADRRAKERLEDEVQAAEDAAKAAQERQDDAVEMVARADRHHAEELSALSAELAEARTKADEAEKRAVAAEARAQASEEETRRAIAFENRRRVDAETELRGALRQLARFEALAEERRRLLDRLTNGPGDGTQALLADLDVPPREQLPVAPRSATAEETSQSTLAAASGNGAAILSRPEQRGKQATRKAASPANE